MTVRQSKQALAEAAALLGTDASAARSYLRAVQHLVGQVSYITIVAAMRTIAPDKLNDVTAVAARTNARAQEGTSE